MRRIDLDIYDVAQRYRAGTSVNKLAKIFGVDRDVIAKRLDRLGIKRRGLGEAQRVAWAAENPPEKPRKCRSCGELKPIEDFHTYGRHRRRKCKPCANEHTRKWRAQNPTKTKGYNSSWYYNNREKALELVKKRRTGENREAFNESRRKYYINNKDHLKSASAYRRGAEGRFTKSDIEEIRKQQKNKCAICRERLSKEHIDHIIPLKHGGTNFRRNIQILCPSCNFKKQARDPIKHMRSLGRLL